VPRGGASSDNAVSRRDLLIGGGAAIGASALTAAGAFGLSAAFPNEALGYQKQLSGEEVVAFFGKNQSGIQTPIQSHGVFAVYKFKHQASRNEIAGVMKAATVEASRLCSGKSGLSDTDPMLAESPARLTVTFGFGTNIFSSARQKSKIPEGFTEIPKLKIDQLEEKWSGGDLLIQIGSDNPLTLSHANRHLSRVVSSVFEPLYTQIGFQGFSGNTRPGETQRNLFGQKDGTINPKNSEEFNDQVWAGPETDWFEGGTQLVLRRISMKLGTWDLLGEHDKSAAIGRDIVSGAPLTGTEEFDTPDLDAKNELGLSVIPDFSHIRRSVTGSDKNKFLRRPFNYDNGVNELNEPDVGLIFAAYTSNIRERFIPVQERLAEMDLLNLWTTPIGSSVFVIPPGCNEGGFIGETLLS
jgi:dye decolorizing peroxidase